MATSVVWPQIFYLLRCLFAALYGDARFYFFMDVKTRITVQGQCRKACIETETAQIDTMDELQLEVGGHVTNVYVDGISGGMY